LAENTNGSTHLLDSLDELWKETTVLKHLGHRFWKTSLLLLRRFEAWVSTQIPTNDTMTQNENSDLSTYVELLNSVSIVQSRVVKFVDTTIRHRLELDAETTVSLIEVVNQIMNEFPTNKIKDLILDRVATTASEPFSHVAGVPAQFRRTNKPQPTTPSFFMSNIFDYPNQFFSTSHIDEETRSQWSRIVADKVIQKYHDKVFGTLSSMKKIEESLKRFKKAKQNIGELSDEDKARLQLQIDCRALGVELQKFGIESKSVLAYQETVRLIEDALKESE
jgi:hypothetical protein